MHDRLLLPLGPLLLVATAQPIGCRYQGDYSEEDHERIERSLMEFHDVEICMRPATAIIHVVLVMCANIRVDPGIYFCHIVRVVALAEVDALTSTVRLAESLCQLLQAGVLFYIE